MLAVCQACQFFLPDIRGYHVLVPSDSRSVVSYSKSPGRPRLEATLHAGEPPSCVGSEQSALTEGDAYVGLNEPKSRYVVEEQCLFRGMDAPPACGSENLGSLWQSSSRPLRLRRQLLMPNLFYKEHGCPGPRMAQPSARRALPFCLSLCYGPCISGHLTGPFCPPRACPKHYGRS